jgi:hypothetical protein
VRGAGDALGPIEDDDFLTVADIAQLLKLVTRGRRIGKTGTDLDAAITAALDELRVRRQDADADDRTLASRERGLVPR